MLMNKIIAFAARFSVAASLFFASGIGEAIKDFITWLFDKSCDPSKHNLPGWEEIMCLFN